MQKLQQLSLLLLATILACLMNNGFKSMSLSRQQTRQTISAGTWYDADSKRLTQRLTRFLQNAHESLQKEPLDQSFAHNTPIAGGVLAIIVPHAAYKFSGQTAAYAYQAAGHGRKVQRVFLLGPSHHSDLAGAALPAETAFATPLGDLPVDVDVIKQLRQYKQFAGPSETQRREYSLEMQLPFIRQVFGAVKIVPILVGKLNQPADIKSMAQILRRCMRPDDLLVVSSDFAHYGTRYHYQPFRTKVRENVRQLDSEAFEHLTNDDLTGFMAFEQRTHDTICGYYSCLVLLAMLPPNSHASLLHYRTSQDSKEEAADNSVSYLAVAFSDGTDSDWPAQGRKVTVRHAP